MSQENVEIVRRANTLFNTGDWDALSELYHGVSSMGAAGFEPATSRV